MLPCHRPVAGRAAATRVRNLGDESPGQGATNLSALTLKDRTASSGARAQAPGCLVFHKKGETVAWGYAPATQSSAWFEALQLVAVTGRSQVSWAFAPRDAMTCRV